MIRSLCLIALLLAAPAAAAYRVYSVTNFDRVRVDGPFEVHVTVGGGGARAQASGEDRVLANLSIEVQGGTLVIRKGISGWGEQGKIDGPAPVITISAGTLRSASVIGGGKLTIDGVVRTPRLDLQVTGAGSIAASGIDTEELAVTSIGMGSFSLSGKAGRARMLTNGSGTILALPLVAGDLLVRLDGPGETQVSARYTADLTSTGLGRIVVTGNPKCTTHAVAGGPILCGPDAKP